MNSLVSVFSSLPQNERNFQVDQTLMLSSSRKNSPLLSSAILDSSPIELSLFFEGVFLEDWAALKA